MGGEKPFVSWPWARLKLALGDIKRIPQPERTNRKLYYFSICYKKCLVTL